MEAVVQDYTFGYPGEGKMRNVPIQIEENSIVVMMPDGPGSKGDEAVAREICNAIAGERFIVLTPGVVEWEREIPDLSEQFKSYCMSVHDMHEYLNKKIRLVIAGTDGIDGTCGVSQGISILKAAKAVLMNGGSVKVFCSFRGDVNEDIIRSIKELSGDIEFYLREEESVKNFYDQTGITGKYFPDFAFFCKPVYTKKADTVLEEIRKNKEKACKMSIVVNFGEHSYQSLFKESTFETRVQYVTTIIDTIANVWPDANIYMLSHDRRQWENHWSDSSFCRLAYHYGLDSGLNVHLIPEDMTHAEILTILPEVDLVITGRMHLSVASIRSRVLPVVYTGAKKDGRYNMSDKVRGMLKSRLGHPELRVGTCVELHDVLQQIAHGGFKSYEDGWLRETEKEEEDQKYYYGFRTKMNLCAEPQTKKCNAMDLLLDMGRKSEDEQKRIAAYESLNNDMKCRLDQLLQSEGEHKAQLQEVQNRLLQREREHEEQLREVQEQLSAMKQELELIRHSRAFKLMTLLWKVRDVVIPFGSRRRKLMKLMLKVIRHPKRALKAISRERIKKLFTAIKNGDMALLEEQFTKVMGGTDIHVELVSILEHVVSDRLEDYERIVLPQTDKPLVSIVIPVYNQFNYTYLCLKSILLNSGDVPYEVIIADDCSNDLTQHISEIAPGVHVAKTPKNLRFLLNCNNAAKVARGQYILFLNNDTQVQPGWLRPLVDLIERDGRIGMVGSKLIYPDGRLQEAGGILWRDGSAWNYGNRQDPSMPQYNYVKEADYISGAAIMIRRSLWEQLGGFDERFAPAYCEDSDLAFAVRNAGYRVMYQPKSVVVHFEGVSNGTDTSSGLKAYQITNQKEFFKKWQKALEKHNEDAVNVFSARDRSIGQKTVLFIDHYVPTFDKDAGSRTVFAYLKMFVEQGYNVKFIGDNFYQSEPYTTVLQQMGIEVLYGSWYAQNWKQWIKENADCFDYAFLNRPHISVNYIDFLRENTKAKIIYYGHDLHFLRVMREFELTGDKRLIAESNSWKEKELSLMRKADMSYYPSEIEAQAVREMDASIRVKAIPAYLFDNVQDVQYQPETRKDLFFIGGFNHGPNVDAVKWLANEVMPLLREKLPGIRVHVAGSGVTNEIKALERDDLIIEGRISDEQLEQFYANCRLNVVPLRYGAGIKGKVVESMRYGLPVVTTSCGAEGILDAQDCLVIADTAEELAECISALYEDAMRLSAMSKAGTAYVREHYSQANAVKVLGAEFDFTRE